MKKTALLILVLLVALPLVTLVSCGESAETTKAPATEAPKATEANAETTSSPATDAPVTTTSPVVTTSASAVTTAPVTTDAPEGPLTVLSGEFEEKNNYFKVTKAKAFALLNGMTFEKGSFSSSIKSAGQNKISLVFCYSKSEDTESYYQLSINPTSYTVSVIKTVNGKNETLYSNFLSAGYNVSSLFNYKIVLEGGKAYCYFFNTLYCVIDVDLPGKQVGFYTLNNGACFYNAKIDETATHTTADTLLFGHSYFELWNSYKNHLSALKDQDFGTIANIGIGGSVASHWYNFKEAVAEYGADLGIYMIGINDLTGGQNPSAIAKYVEDTLTYLKEQNPDFRCVLISVNQCNARTNIMKQVSETNVLYKKIAAKYDYILYAEVENLFCGSDGMPIAKYFTDGLHPTNEGYQMIAKAIDSALKGENQPEGGDDDPSEALDEVKSAKIASIVEYSKLGYRDAEWATAEPIYNQAVNAIKACKTEAEVKALDLSSYINSLKEIKNKADYLFENVINLNNSKGFSNTVFDGTLAQSTNGVYNLTSFGIKVDTSTVYENPGVTFRLSNYSAEIGVGGFFFNATVNENNMGINGYLLNYCTDPNFIQIYYCENAYNNDGSASTLMYIGGWVFPAEVEDTLFRAEVRDGYVYVYTENDYQNIGVNGYGCSADLTYGGLFKLYDKGSLGVISWEEKSYDFEIFTLYANEAE